MENSIPFTKKVSLRPSKQTLAKKVYTLASNVLHSSIPAGLNGVYDVYENGKQTNLYLQIQEENGEKNVQINRGFLKNENNAPLLETFIKVMKAKKLLKQYKNGTTLSGKAKKPSEKRSVSPAKEKVTSFPYQLDEHLQLRPTKKTVKRINIGDYAAYELDEFACKKELEAFLGFDFDVFEVIDEQHKQTFDILILDERFDYYNPSLYFLVKNADEPSFEQSFAPYLHKEPLPYVVPAEIARMQCKMCWGKGCVQCAL